MDLAATSGDGQAALLFDVGDTLLGFPVHSWAEVDRLSFQALVAALPARTQHPPSVEQLVATFGEVVAAAHREATPHLREVTARSCLQRTLAAVGIGDLSPQELDRLERVWSQPRLEVRRLFDDVPGVLEALASLRQHGLRLGLISNIWLSGPLVREHLDGLGLLRPFDSVVLSCEVGYVKPHPEPFQRALRELGVPAERAWHVGDNPHADVAGAAAAGMHPVLLRRPPYPGQVPPPETLYQGPPPELVVDSLHPLVELAHRLVRSRPSTGRAAGPT